MPPKSAVVAGLLQLFLGTFGIGRFYIGTNGIAVTQLLLGLTGLLFTMICYIGLPLLILVWIWTLIDAIMMFAHAVPDGSGRRLG